MTSTLRAAWSRLVSSWRRDQLDAELAEELDGHLAMLEEEYRQRGLAPDAAGDAARRDLGNTTLVRETHRAQRGFPWLDTLRQDVRYGLRGLRRDAGVAIFAILIVGLGVGASTTVFSVVHAVLLRPLSFQAPEQLVWIGNIADNGVDEWQIQVDHFVDLRERSHSLADAAGYFAYYGPDDSKLTGGGEAERLGNVPVTCSFLRVLGVEPLLGRHFTEEECAQGGPAAVMLTHTLWTRRYAGDPTVVGRVIGINGAPVTVVGVLSPQFDFATVFDPGTRIDLFSAFPLSEQTNRLGNVLAVIGRLRPVVTIEQARAEIEALGVQLTRDEPGRNTLRPKVAALEERVSGRFRPAMLVLAGAVAVVMLIVCANLSNLQMARAAARQREMAIRVALGAGRGRLARQLLIESLMLAGAGAIVGLMFALAAVRAIAAVDAFSIPLLASVRIDAIVLGVTAAVAVTTGVVFGLMPALNVPAEATQRVLRESGRNVSEGRRLTSLRAALVASEVALACVLLAGAALLVRSFLNVVAVDPGFRAEQVSAMRIDRSFQLPEQEARNAHYDNVLQRTRTIPGAASALADVLPLAGNRSRGVAGQGQQYERDALPQGYIRVVSDGYFRTLGIPLHAGRDFTADDALSGEPVVIVNQRLAEMLWSGQEAVGQILAHGGGVPRRVVGVVGNVRHASLESGFTGELYLPIRQTDDYSRIDVVVRSEIPAEALAGMVRAALLPIEPDLQRAEWRTLDQLVDRAVSPRRFVVLLLSGFAGFAVVLACLGLYAVVSYSVSRRTQEIAIRMALGESGGSVRWRVLVETLQLAALGLVLGLLAAWPLGRLLSSLLYETAPTDPVTFITVPIVLLGVALLAGYLPARRAARLDPLLALRAD
jgi:predicted permease